MDGVVDLDDLTAERLLRGDLPADDAPVAFRPVAELLAAARGFDVTASAAGDAAPDADVVAAMVAAVRGEAPAAAEGTVALAPRRARRLSARAGAAVLAVALLSASGAAAATGSLPDAAQDRLARVADRLGITLPTSAGAGAGRAPAGQQRAGGDDGNAGVTVPAGTHGADVAGTARTTEATGREKGEAVSTVARDGQGAPTGTHRPVDAAPAGGGVPGPPAEPPAAADLPGPASPPTTAPTSRGRP